MSTDNKQQLIQLRAYRLWEEEGRPDGRHDHHWSEAERQLQDEDLQPVVETEGAAQPPDGGVRADGDGPSTAGAAQQTAAPAPGASAMPRAAATPGVTAAPVSPSPASGDSRTNRPGAIRSTYR